MESRTLEITLQYAKDLNKVNIITKMDVYALVSISGGDKNSSQKTKTPVDREGDANPSWNFPMKFQLDEEALQKNLLTLDFKLVCERALGDKDVGEVNVPVKELLDAPAKGDGKQFVSYQVRKPSGKPKGQLTFCYLFSEKNAVPKPYVDYNPPCPPVNVDGTPPGSAAYPTGSSLPYPPPPHHGPVYPPPVAYPESSGLYPPPSGSGYPPPPSAAPQPGAYPPPPPPAYGHPYPPPPQPGYGYRLHHGYGYPPLPGYGYPPPPPPGYGYPAPIPVHQPAKKNKFGLGLGAGLLGGAIGGLLVGDMISDGVDFDLGCGF